MNTTSQQPLRPGPEVGRSGRQGLPRPATVHNEPFTRHERTHRVTIDLRALAFLNIALAVVAALASGVGCSGSIRTGPLAPSQDAAAEARQREAVQLNRCLRTTYRDHPEKGVETDGFGRTHGGKADPAKGSTTGVKNRWHVGRLIVGSGTTTGFCEKGDIAKNVRLRASAIRACYEKPLQQNASLSGKLTVLWTVGLDGCVSRAALSGSTVSDQAVGECVVRVVWRMAFRRPEGGVCVVQWPFVFNP